MTRVVPLFLALLAIAGAQEGAPPVACRFLCFARAKDGTAALVAAAPGGKAADCPLPLSTFSKPVALLPAGGVIEFRKAAGDPAAVTSARIPAGMKQALLLFLPSEDEGKQLHETVVLEDSPKAFPADGSVVLNLYRQNVRFILGEHQILLPPGKTASLARPVKRDQFNMAAIAFQFQTGESWRTAAETMVRFPEGQRHLFVTFVDPATKRPRMRSFRVDG